MARREAALASFLLLVLALWAGCERAERSTEPAPRAGVEPVVATGATDPTSGRPNARSERIGSVGKGFRPRSLAVSFDLQRIAWVDRHGERCRVVVDRRRGPWFAQCTDPVFSPDGSTVAYFSSKDPGVGPQVNLVVNGTVSPLTVGIDGPVAFAERGSAWAAIAAEWLPQPSPGPTPADGTPAEAPPRRLIAFAPRGVVGEYRDTTAPVVSPDGAHVAFIASDAQARQSLIVDGKVVREFGAPEVEFIPVLKTTAPKPNLQPDSVVRYLVDGSLAGVALGKDGWTVFHGDTAWASYPGIRLPEGAGFEVTGSPLLSRPAVLGGSLVTAAKAPVACWWERLDGEIDHWRVVCNGKPIDDHTCNAPATSQAIVPAADGQSAMYACQILGDPLPDGKTDERNVWVMAGGKKHGPHRFVWGLTLTPDGKHWAYAAADGIDDTWFYQFDGKRFDGPWQHAFPASISPDGKSIAWAASPRADGKRVDLVRDGVIVTRGDMVMAPPRWNGDRVEFALKRGNSVRRVVID